MKRLTNISLAALVILVSFVIGAVAVGHNQSIATRVLPAFVLTSLYFWVPMIIGHGLVYWFRIRHRSPRTHRNPKPPITF
jgi:hypothetical protein